MNFELRSKPATPPWQVSQQGGEWAEGGVATQIFWKTVCIVRSRALFGLLPLVWKMKRYSVAFVGKSWTRPEDSLLVEYIPGKFATAHPLLAAKGYHLTVFTDYEYALWFTKQMAIPPLPPCELWECVVRGPVPLPRPVAPWYLPDVAQARGFLSIPMGSWDNFTAMFEEVKLTRELAEIVESKKSLYPYSRTEVIK